MFATGKRVSEQRRSNTAHIANRQNRSFAYGIRSEVRGGFRQMDNDKSRLAAEEIAQIVFFWALPKFPELRVSALADAYELIINKHLGEAAPAPQAATPETCPTCQSPFRDKKWCAVWKDSGANKQEPHELVSEGLCVICADTWHVSQAEAPRPQTVQEPQRRNAMEFSLEQAQSLLKMFGGEEAAITVTTGPDGSLLAYHTDYPEEGSVDL
jgi:hypothetical protein